MMMVASLFDKIWLLSHSLQVWKKKILQQTGNMENSEES